MFNHFPIRQTVRQLTRQFIRHLFRQIKLIFRSELPGKPFFALLSGVNPSKVTPCTVRHVISFFREEFQEEWRKGGVLKSTVYAAYCQWSEARNIREITPAIFWKFVKSAPQAVKIRAEKRPGGRQRIVVLEKGSEE